MVFAVLDGDNGARLLAAHLAGEGAMMPNERETVNLLDQLRESDRKPTEALLEIAHPNKIDAFENPYDKYWEQEYAEAVRSSKDGRVFLDAILERRHTSELGELRRRLYVAERHGFVKLAAMWRRLIEKEEQRP